MRTFKLMREVIERPDPITGALADSLSSQRRSTLQLSLEPIDVLMRFWNMKQDGELTRDEMPAVWLVLMRHVNVTVTVRALLENCFAGPVRYPAVVQLEHVRRQYLFTGLTDLRVPFITKMSAALCEALRNAAAVRDETDAHVLDPQDCWALLQACEVAVALGEQEKKRVHELLKMGSGT